MPSRVNRNQKKKKRRRRRKEKKRKTRLSRNTGRAQKPREAFSREITFALRWNATVRSVPLRGIVSRGIAASLGGSRLARRRERNLDRLARKLPPAKQPASQPARRRKCTKVLTGPGVQALSLSVSPLHRPFLYASVCVRVEGKRREREREKERFLLARQIINNQAGVCAVLARFANEPAFSRCRLEAYNYMLASLLVCSPPDTYIYIYVRRVVYRVFQLIVNRSKGKKD